jgi:hypothetical protein
MSFVTLKNANLLLAFLLELGVLVALGYWGFSTGSSTLAKIGLGIGVPVLAIIIWGMFGAPRSDWQLQGIWYILLQIVFFGSAVAALYATGQRTLALLFALIFLVNTALVHIL